MTAKTTYKGLTILLLFIFSKIAVGQIVEIPLNDLKFNFTETKKVFVKKIDYFEYKSDKFIIDSINLTENILKFDLDGNEGLFLISDNKLTPSTYIPFIQSPKIYHYMFCSNFYKSRNFIYLSNNYSKEEFDFFKWFYKNFTAKSFDEKLYTKGDYKRIEKEQARELVENRKRWFLKKLHKRSNKFSRSFINYIKTEIELGAINQYLNWYENIYEKQIKNEICLENQNGEHDHIYKEYLSEKWDKNSIQYYRLIERIINYRLSKEKCEFEIYHKNTNDRIKIAEQILNNEIFEKYKKNCK